MVISTLSTWLVAPDVALILRDVAAHSSRPGGVVPDIVVLLMLGQRASPSARRGGRAAGHSDLAMGHQAAPAKRTSRYRSSTVALSVRRCFTTRGRGT